MIKTIVFSKDRPLQLTSYLQSFFFCTNQKEENVSVISPSFKNYEKLISQYPEINWITEEKGFQNTLCEQVFNVPSEDTILFGCDDCIWIRQVHLENAERLLNKHNLLGFSFRLGMNICPYFTSLTDKETIKVTMDEQLVQWIWRHATGHYGYPFELMGTLYSAKLVKRVLNAALSNIKTPNFFESHGTTLIVRDYHEFPPYMGIFKTNNYLVAQDINRVQSEFPNKFDGSETEVAEVLLERYKESCVINWQKLYEIVPEDVFVGRKYLEINKGDI